MAHNISRYFAIPFNSPTYCKTETVVPNSIIAMGDLVAEELQDSNSAASKFLRSLKNPPISLSSSSCVVRWKNLKVPSDEKITQTQ